MKKCFIICPIGEENSEIRKRSDMLFKHIIQPVCNQCGYESIRVDLINDIDKIDSTIIEHLNNSDLVIADLTGHNPNAFFEIGYRSALRKPSIQLIREGEIIPFDVAPIRTIHYDLSDLDKVDNVKSKLSETINAIKINDDSKTDNLSGSTVQSVQPQILGLLFDIKDKLDILSDKIGENNDKIIKSIVSSFTSELTQPQESTDAAIIKALLPEMIKNPNFFNQIAELGDKFNNIK